MLDELRVLSPSVVKAGEINWGLWYPGRRYRFETEYLKNEVAEGEVESSKVRYPLRMGGMNLTK